VVENEDGGMYLNVNMGGKEGIERAQRMGLSNFGDGAFLIRTPYLFELGKMFHPGRYGKCFAILRNPIERAIDVFHHLRDMNRPVFVNMTLEEYAQSPYCEQNWMVRFLSDEMNDPVGAEHLDMAKHVLGRKCIVGFTERLKESVKRFAKFFKWDEGLNELKVRDCLDTLLDKSKVKDDVNTKSSSNSDSGGIKTSPYNWQVDVSKDPRYGKGSKVWEMLKEKNSLDMELYDYASNLFDSQALYFSRL